MSETGTTTLEARGLSIRFQGRGGPVALSFLVPWFSKAGTRQGLASCV